MGWRTKRTDSTRVVTAVALTMSVVFNVTLTGCDDYQAYGKRSEVSASAPTASDPMSYRLQQGRAYIYDIRIEADFPNSKNSITGRSEYRVIAVESGTGRMKLSNFGELHFNEQPKPGRPLSLGDVGDSATRLLVANCLWPRTVTLEPKGRVVDSSGQSQLPYMLGNLWALVLEPLPEGSENHWESRRGSQIRERGSLGPIPIWPGKARTSSGPPRSTRSITRLTQAATS